MATPIAADFRQLALVFWNLRFTIGRFRLISTGSRSVISTLLKQTRMNDSISSGAVPPCVDVLRVFRLCCDELGTSFSLEFSRIHQTVIQCLLCSDPVRVFFVIDN